MVHLKWGQAIGGPFLKGDKGGGKAALFRPLCLVCAATLSCGTLSKTPLF